MDIENDEGKRVRATICTVVTDKGVIEPNLFQNLQRPCSAPLKSSHLVALLSPVFVGAQVVQ